MGLLSMLSILEESVYRHSKYLDRCRYLIRKASRGNMSKLIEGFAALARESRKLEEVLTTLSNSCAESLFSEDVDMLAAVVFYVYEVSVEDERDLWSKYEKFNPSENVEEHHTRLNRMKALAQRILETIEGNEGKT
ncbi:MAG: hypothetical protein QW775_00475 [Ignisphaera sp.]|uniref:Uncharacterized protein n=1 Tax=Ignisphaera aggregans TaxID=334771 RepID=A0A7C4NK84_9CREN